MTNLNLYSAARTSALSLVPLLVLATAAKSDETFPDISELPAHADLPDPLVMFDGRPVKTKDQWVHERRPELKALFEHYMYGTMPPAPEKVDFVVERVNPAFFNGKATKKEITIQFGTPGTPAIQLLLVVPNDRQGPAPVFLGTNFCGNHTLVEDPSVAIPQTWVYGGCPGCKDNLSTEEGRGGRMDRWPVELVIDRGYALAAFCTTDVDPDKDSNDFTDGVQPHYFKPGQTEPGPHDWGTIAAWAWGLHRAVDYLVTDDEINDNQIAVYGHSRNGKAALLAGAFDERIDLVVPHQAGCCGTSPSRSQVGESVKAINRKKHWFNDVFPQFSTQVERLPFDQHSLVALVAPRPVLVTNAVEDTWADPEGQFRVLQAADPVYRFLGAEGLEASEMPELRRLVDSNLGYYIREAKHSAEHSDWEVFLNFADKHFGFREFVPLFDGTSLDGWTVRSGTATYRAEDGTIVGTTTVGSPNTFLCTDRKYGDFELRFEVKCDPPLNSGVQIRAQVLERDSPQPSDPEITRKAGRVYGYQCEIARAEQETSGNFWDEARHGKWHDDFSNKPEARQAFHDNQWNRYRILAQGDHIRSWLNGTACADFHDDEDATGLIGLQVHGIHGGTGPYQVRWRNIMVRELRSAR